MKKRIKIFLPLLTLLLLSLVMYGCGDAKENEISESGEPKKIIVSENAKEMQDDTPPLEFKGKEEFSLPKEVAKIIDYVDSDTLLVTGKENEGLEGRPYLYHAGSKKLSPLNDSNSKNQNFYDLSGDLSKILYSVDNDLFTFDITTKTNEKIKSLESGDDAFSFADFTGTKVFYYNYEKSSFNVKNLKTKDIKSLDITPLKDFGFSHDPISTPDNNNLYFAANIGKNNGIYKLNTTTMDEFRPELLLSKSNDGVITQFDFLDANTLLFSGDYNNKSGIYIYNLEKESITQLLEGFTDKEEGNRAVFYKLSKDKSKLLFDTVGTEINLANIYLATLENNSLSAEKLLYKDSNFHSAISISAWWSPDNTSFLINEAKDEGLKLIKYTL